MNEVDRNLIDGIALLKPVNHKERLKSALEKFDNVIKSCPDYLIAYYYRAVAHNELGNSVEAKDDFLYVIEHSSPDTSVYYNLSADALEVLVGMEFLSED